VNQVGVNSFCSSPLSNTPNFSATKLNHPPLSLRSRAFYSLMNGRQGLNFTLSKQPRQNARGSTHE
ncbi:hypothetical protein, partial [Thiorhodococcus mannitoliphagus]|uniref:hypothetical protein n=1 Tax=Thiorhodococcus mannitoliphagus TaxID=329406 RepID=UPI00197F3C86